MIDNKFNGGGTSSCETHLTMYQSKQSPIALKKVALREVQNDNRNVMYNYPESSCSLGGKLMNGTELSGSKRSNPICSPSSGIHQSFKGIGVNEHTIYAGGEDDVKPGKRRALGVAPGLEILHSVDSNGITDERRTERLFNLLKLLKRCDESDKKGFIEFLHGLTPSELSKLAIILEKRSMNLSVEEGKEIQRMKALNILGNLQ